MRTFKIAPQHITEQCVCATRGLGGPPTLIASYQLPTKNVPVRAPAIAFFHSFWLTTLEVVKVRVGSAVGRKAGEGGNDIFSGSEASVLGECQIGVAIGV